MARSLRVVAVTPLYPPVSLVGAWLATHEFLRHLAAHGHDVNVVTYADTKTYEHEGVKVWPRTCNPDDVLAGCDLMLNHLGDNQQAAGEAEHRGLPLVRMVHGWLTHAADMLADHPVALAVFNSHNLADSIPHTCPSIVANPPTDVEAMRVQPGRRVTLVNMSAPKGAHTFWRVAERMPDVQFLGVRGGYGEQVHGKRKNVQLMDPTPTVVDVYRQTRVLLMPSAYETWGRTGMEAMASGIPVIAHPASGLVESLGDAGIFVDRDDIDGWERELRRLMSSQQAWREASERARARAEAFDPLAQLERFRLAVEALA